MATPEATTPAAPSRRMRKRLQQQEKDAGNATTGGTGKRLKNSAFLPVADAAEAPTTTWRGVIEYDGSQFHGFQAQEQTDRMRTVQEVVEDAIARTTGERVRVRGASRTDKGVHARGQVIAFPSRCLSEATAFRDALNTRLPEDVVCHRLQRQLSQTAATAAFDPRAQSKGKIYEYVVVFGRIRPVLDRHHVWFLKKSLDVAKMRAAAALLVAPPSAKDFSAFTPPKSSQLNDADGKGNVCTLFAVDIEETRLNVDDEEEVHETPAEDTTTRLCIRFRGDRFLYKMVRNLVGTLVDVGLGRLEPEAIPVILETKDRSKAGQGAPPQGLTLIRGIYSDENGE